MTQFFLSVQWEKVKESFWLKKVSHLSWDKNINCIGYPTDNGQSSIIAKAVNKQNTSKLLLYKLYFKMIFKMILKSFEFQCDFDFQITTSKMIWILILNHLYLGDLILNLKSSTYDDFAHLWLYRTLYYDYTSTHYTAPCTMTILLFTAPYPVL